MRKDRTCSVTMPTQPSSLIKLLGEVMLTRVKGGMGVSKEETTGIGL